MYVYTDVQHTEHQACYWLCHISSVSKDTLLYQTRAPPLNLALAQPFYDDVLLMYARVVLRESMKVLSNRLSFFFRSLVLFGQGCPPTRLACFVVLFGQRFPSTCFVFVFVVLFG